jgi:transcriptional regulator with XRE-family HTH domain
LDLGWLALVILVLGGTAVRSGNVTDGWRAGCFLRARREQIRPDDVGLDSGPRRRVPGLRREELAMLAGISVDYYLRLEQGRDQHPSSQVLNALARALRLDIKATEHLHRLAGLQAAHSPRPVAETAAEDLDQLIDQIPLPAIITNRYQDVLAANAIARALSPGFTPGENFLRWRLLAPTAREFFVDWDEATEVAVSGLRESAAGDLDDPRLRALIDELSASSDRFRELWARADVGYRTGILHMRHPLAGDLYLRRTRLSVPDSQTQVFIYHPEPGSDSAKALKALAAS